MQSAAPIQPVAWTSPHPIIKLTDAEREVFRKRVEPLGDKLVQMAGGRTKQVLDQLRSEIAAAKK